MAQLNDGGTEEEIPVYSSQWYNFTYGICRYVLAVPTCMTLIDGLTD